MDKICGEKEGTQCKDYLEFNVPTKITRYLIRTHNVDMRDWSIWLTWDDPNNPDASILHISRKNDETNLP